MNIIFLKRFADDIHGTLTLTVRLAKYFQEMGHTVFLVKYQKSKLIKGVVPENNILSIKDILLPDKVFKQYCATNPVDVIYCLTNEAVITAFILKRKYYPDAKIIIGVYHPNQFMEETKYFDNYINILNKKIAKNIPGENLVFMDSICLKTTEDYYKVKYPKASLISLPIDTPAYNMERKVEFGKIVSIGRIVDFKRYNFFVLDSLFKLKKENYSFKYHVVGDGDELPVLKKKVSDLNLEEDVVFHGKVEYEELISILENAYLFIGMGTSVIESAILGIPSLVAIAYNNSDTTYGFINNVPYGIVGEFGEKLPSYHMEDSLRAVLDISKQDYLKLSEDSYKAASLYSIRNISAQLLEAFKNADRAFFITINLRHLILLLLGKIQSHYFIKDKYRIK